MEVRTIYNETFDVDTCLQVMLMKVSKNFGWKCMQRLNELGIQPRQLPVLIAISREEGISQKRLAEVLHNTPPTVNVSVQRLEKAGLVIRERDQQDQRKIHVLLTEQGTTLMNSLKDSMEEMEKEIFLGFDPEELCKVREYLERILKNIDKIPGESCPDDPVGGKEHSCD